jgi:carbamate kinase
VEDAGRGWRRVVPSPHPKEIVELPLLKRMVAAGEIVLAAGGGGIPVTRNAAGHYRGLEAVIDKDYTSGILAAALNADRLVILTGVDQIQRDFGTPHAAPLPVLSAAEAQELLDRGQFPPGSMGPKVQAAVDFLKTCQNPVSEVLITSCERAADAINGKTGTRIVRSRATQG